MVCHRSVHTPKGEQFCVELTAASIPTSTHPRWRGGASPTVPGPQVDCGWLREPGPKAGPPLLPTTIPDSDQSFSQQVSLSEVLAMSRALAEGLKRLRLNLAGHHAQPSVAGNAADHAAQPLWLLLPALSSGFPSRSGNGLGGL